MTEHRLYDGQGWVDKETFATGMRNERQFVHGHQLNQNVVGQQTGHKNYPFSSNADPNHPLYKTLWNQGQQTKSPSQPSQPKSPYVFINQD